MSMSERSFFGIFIDKSAVWGFFLVGIIINIAFAIYFVAARRLDKKNYFRYILPALLYLSAFGFIFFSPVFVFNQILVVLSFFLFALIYNDILGDTRFVFTNLISFFTVFIFFFDCYSFFYVLNLPYWFVIFLVSGFSMLILLYKMKHIDMGKNYLYMFLLLFAIIISEFFLFSFFWPIQSIFVKSLLLLFVYYLFWGLNDLYVNNKFILRNVIKFMIFFVVVLAMSLGSLMLNIKK